MNDTAVAIVERTLTDAGTVAVDSALLDSTAGDTTRPSGLLYNVSDLGAQGGGLVALTPDLAKIAGAISDAGLDTENLMFFMNPRQALVARGLLTGPRFSTYSIIGTSALAAGTIVGVAPSAIAMYISPPQIEVVPDGLVHMADDARDSIDTDAVSEVVKAAWQTNLILLKLRLRCTWAPLASAAVQKIESCTW